MESPRKFNDCYFYYYSTCTKGDNCVFRHEPSALGCETMCSAWQQGKCLDKRCKLRHMELRKNRKQIPCYWENQPGGCRKIHCPFMHKNPEARTDGIAPSQPIQLQSVAGSVNVPEQEQPQMNSGVPPPVPAPQPVPLLWQQQRQAVVLDSAILGVLPGSGELMGGRRVLPPHEAPPNPYAQLPVDPLVVNFEEESDNESAPSSTPTKIFSPDDAQKIARSKSQELALLEKIQEEAAAYYRYDALPRPPHQPRLPHHPHHPVRACLAKKFDNPSRSALDFKILSLEEIRARKKNDAIIQNKPIAINLSRKRKSCTQETITASGNKIIKVVRNKSIVYKKLNTDAPVVSGPSQIDQKQSDKAVDRKRKLSDQSDSSEIQKDELVDNCFEFKRIKITRLENTSKPKLIRNSSNKSGDEQSSADTVSNRDTDSDSEVQIVELNREQPVDLSDDSEIIDLETTKLGEPIDIVDLSEDQEDSDITVSDLDLDLSKNVPDVVASCRKQTNKEDCAESNILQNIDRQTNKEDCSDNNILQDIDSLLDDDDL